LTKKGLFGCGCNNYGQLGLGNTENLNTLARINIENVLSFSCGIYHSIVQTKTGLYSCGDNNDGQLGLGDNLPKNTLQKINLLPNLHNLNLTFGPPEINSPK